MKRLVLNDIKVEFEITSNRPDCFSVIGLAREAAATFDKPLTLHTPVVKGRKRFLQRHAGCKNRGAIYYALFTVPESLKMSE